MEHDECERLAKRFMAEQPALGIYISAMTENFAEQGDEFPVIELALSAWQVMTKISGQTFKTVTPEEVEAAEAVNQKMLQNLGDASEFEWNEAASGTLLEYTQREILGFTTEILMSGNEETPELAPENIGMAMIAVKTVVDCLDQQSEVR